MYLHYDVAPAFLNGQRFPIDRPVASEKEADAFVQHARKQIEAGQKKSYFGFALLDINKKEILKRYLSAINHTRISEPTVTARKEHNGKRR